MNENRRSFLKNAGRTALGLGCGLPLLSAGCEVAHGEQESQWVLVVDVDESAQVDRVVRRDRVSPEQARAILAAQPSREQRLAWADDVIDNSGATEDLTPQVARLHHHYLSLKKGSEPFLQT